MSTEMLNIKYIAVERHYSAKWAKFSEQQRDITLSKVLPGLIADPR